MLAFINNYHVHIYIYIQTTVYSICGHNFATELHDFIVVYRFDRCCKNTLLVYSNISRARMFNMYIYTHRFI